MYEKYERVFENRKFFNYWDIKKKGFLEELKRKEFKTFLIKFDLFAGYEFGYYKHGKALANLFETERKYKEKMEKSKKKK